MDYPKDFIERVKAEYPGWDDLHKHIDSGSVWVGRYLDDSRPNGICPEAVIAASESGNLEEVKAAAEQAIRRNELYREWGALYDAQK